MKGYYQLRLNARMSKKHLIYKYILDFMKWDPCNSRLSVRHSSLDRYRIR